MQIFVTVMQGNGLKLSGEAVEFQGESIKKAQIIQLITEL